MSAAMDVGIGLPNTIPGTDWRLVVERARRADGGPFSTLGVLDRLAYDSIDPLRRRPAAAVTERIGLATMIAIGTCATPRCSPSRRRRSMRCRASASRWDSPSARGSTTTKWRRPTTAAAGRFVGTTCRSHTRRRRPGRPTRHAAPGRRHGRPAFARMARYADGYAHNGGPPRAFARAAASARAAWNDLDARNYFALPRTPKPSLIRNQFGFTLGGPVRENRSFFFIAYEGLRQKAGTARRASVPTERMRLGDLSELGVVIRDPFNGAVYGSVIPSNRIDPIAQEVIQAYPLPNLPGVRGNRVEIGNRIEDGNDVSVKIDHQLFGSTLMTGRYSYSLTRVLDPFRIKAAAE